MAADGNGAGGPAPHVPVMLDEVVSALRPGSGNLIVDGTFGAGGYSRALLDAGASVLAIDRDPEAIAEGAVLAKASGGRLTLVQGRFGELDRIAREHGISAADGVVLDIGVSSMQLDRAERGFSFNRDGPLDMRMERTGPSAADVVNRAETRDLTRIIGILGEERQAGRIARAIAAQREEAPYARTRELAGTIEKTLGRRPGDRIHPATRTFQALRIFVNRELGELADALFAAEQLLRAGGRLAVVTFHSLEDRIVKQFFASRCGRGGGSRHRPQQAGPEPSFRQQQRSAMTASEAEIEINPRSRSARLRFGERTDAPAMEPDMSIFRLPDLASADRFSGAGA